MLKKIVLETTDTNGTTKTTIDLTEYTEMVIKMTIKETAETMAAIIAEKLNKK